MERIIAYATRVRGSDGVEYGVAAWGERQPLGTWNGWLRFEPTKPGGPALHTERETTQPNRDALIYWAEGLEPIYLEGALNRAA